MEPDDIDEGTLKIVTKYYIPEIKSIDFLNLTHRLGGKAMKKERIHKNTDKVLPIDAFAIDVLCVNCYECIKITDVDIHSITC
jgi:hypothetical protein